MSQYFSRNTTPTPPCARGWRRPWPATEAVLLPIADELGLPFTVDELRAYETRLKLSRIKPDVPIEEGDEDEDEDFEGYWLLDRGWEHDESIFKK